MNTRTSAWVAAFSVQFFMGPSKSRSDANNDLLACLSRSRSAFDLVLEKQVEQSKLVVAQALLGSASLLGIEIGGERHELSEFASTVVRSLSRF